MAIAHRSGAGLRPFSGASVEPERDNVGSRIVDHSARKARPGAGSPNFLVYKT